MQRIVYGIANKLSGDLVCVKAESTSDGSDPFSEFRYELTKSKNHPEFLVSDFKQALYVYHNDTPSYNTSAEKPGHGYVDMKFFEIVKVICQIEPMLVPKILVLGNDINLRECKLLSNNQQQLLVTKKLNLKVGEFYFDPTFGSKNIYKIVEIKDSQDGFHSEITGVFYNDL